MQKTNENAGAVYSMPQCITRYERGMETLMIQTYANRVRLIVNLDTDESRLMVGRRLYNKYRGTDPDTLRRMTSAAESLSLTTTPSKSSDRVRAMS